ncbi:outer membrane protein assembly factor BamB family protein, partial [Streptomyces sp. NPDC002920]
GVMAVALTGYLVLGPPDTDGTAQASPTGSAASRWGSLPAGWKPWQTTVAEDAERGERKAPDAEFDRSPFCTTDRGAVYCGGSALLPERIDGATGRTLWRTDLAPADTPVDRYVSSVLGVHEGVVLVQMLISEESGQTQEQYVVALDSDSGTRIWSRTVSNDSYGSVYAAGLVLLQEGDGRSVTARSARDGAERWKIPLPAGYLCSLLSVGDRPYVECVTEKEDSDATQFLVIDPDDGSVRRLDSPAASAGFTGTADGMLVFVESDVDVISNSGDLAYTRIVRVDPESGRREVTKLGGTYRGLVVLEHGTLWFSTSSGQVTAVSPRTGNRVWESRTTLESPGDVTVDDSGRTVYLATGSGRVAALDAAKGTLLWESSARAEILGSGNLPDVLLDEGALVVATPDGTVFTLDPAHPDRTPVSG